MKLTKKIQVKDSCGKALSGVSFETEYGYFVSDSNGNVTITANSPNEEVKVNVLGFDTAYIPFSKLRSPILVDKTFNSETPYFIEEYTANTSEAPTENTEETQLPEVKMSVKKESIVSRHWGKMAFAGLVLFTLSKSKNDAKTN